MISVICRQNKRAQTVTHTHTHPPSAAERGAMCATALTRPSVRQSTFYTGRIAVIFDFVQKSVFAQQNVRAAKKKRERERNNTTIDTTHIQTKSHINMYVYTGRYYSILLYRYIRKHKMVMLYGYVVALIISVLYTICCTGVLLVMYKWICVAVCV